VRQRHNRQAFDRRPHSFFEAVVARTNHELTLISERRAVGGRKGSGSSLSHPGAGAAKRGCFSFALNRNQMCSEREWTGQQSYARQWRAHSALGAEHAPLRVLGFGGAQVPLPNEYTNDVDVPAVVPITLPALGSRPGDMALVFPKSWPGGKRVWVKCGFCAADAGQWPPYWL
jgi:hypothetical protein